MRKTEGGRERFRVCTVIESSLFSSVDYWDVGKGLKIHACTLHASEYIMRSILRYYEKYLYMQGG